MNSKKTHEFGGSWTAEKLERVRKYLSAYTTIFRKQSWAITTYVDAFAGAGHRVDSTKEEPVDQENAEFLKGSARIALEVEPPFNNYLFIEQIKIE
jgi:three-Cys-motif partner protein